MERIQGTNARQIPVTGTQSKISFTFRWDGSMQTLHNWKRMLPWKSRLHLHSLSGMQVTADNAL